MGKMNNHMNYDLYGTDWLRRVNFKLMNGVKGHRNYTEYVKYVSWKKRGKS